MKEVAGYRAFNYLYFIYLFAFVTSGGFFMYLQLAEDVFSIILLIIGGIFFLLLLIDDIYYIFTEQGILFVHFIGENTTLKWNQIIKIVKSSGFDSVKELPHYSLIFNEQKDGIIKKEKFIIPSTPKIKKCIETYYKGEITLSKKVKKDLTK